MKKAPLLLSILIALLVAGGAKAAVIYWDPEGTTTQTTANLTGTWNTTSAQWSTSSAQSSSLIAWNTGDAACFCAQTGTPITGAFTVSVNSTISCGGIFNGSLGPSGYNVTVGGTGALYFNGGNNDALDVAGSDGDPLIVTIPIIGPGTATIEGTDQIYLEASNSYSGGTLIGYVANSYDSIVNFGSYAFGTGPIIFSNCSGSALVAIGQAPIIIPNAVTNIETNVTFNMNIVANAAGVNFTGPWNFSGAKGTAPTFLGSGGGGTNLLIISGQISGTNGFTKYNLGMLELTGSNTYGLNTTLGSTAVSNGWLIVANTNGSATGVSPVIIQSGSTGTGTLTGSGTITGTVTSSGNISATNMPGGCATLTTGSETWNAHSTNIWAVNNIAGTAGASNGWDVVAVNGSVTLSSFTLKLVSLTSANKQGTLAAFDNTTNYSWPILTATNGINGFNTNNISILTSSFSAPSGLNGGSFNVSTNASGGITTMYLNFKLPVPQPTIAVNPPVFVVSSGGTAVISTTTAGSSLIYQWQLNGGPLNNADIVGGETNSSLTISPVEDTDAGDYTVTVSNLGGSASADAGLVVIDPPTYSAGTFSFSFYGPTTAVAPWDNGYRIWATTDVTQEPVEDFWGQVGGGSFTTGANTFTDPSAVYQSEYYCITVP